MASYGRFTPRMAKLVKILETSSEPLERLTAAGELVETLEHYQRLTVATLRQRETSWDEIAQALGLTRQGVIYRYG